MPCGNGGSLGAQYGDLRTAHGLLYKHHRRVERLLENLLRRLPTAGRITQESLLLSARQELKKAKKAYRKARFDAQV